jgi:hypothetical protein
VRRGRGRRCRRCPGCRHRIRWNRPTRRYRRRRWSSRHPPPEPVPAVLVLPPLLAPDEVDARRSSDHSIDEIGAIGVGFSRTNTRLAAARDVGRRLAVDGAESFDHFRDHFEFPTQGHELSHAVHGVGVRLLDGTAGQTTLVGGPGTRLR